VLLKYAATRSFSPLNDPRIGSQSIAGWKGDSSDSLLGGTPPRILSDLRDNMTVMGMYECDESALWYATYYARLPLLLQMSSFEARSCDLRGRTALHWCPVWGLPAHIQAASKLIDLSCPMNKQDITGQTALHIAAKYGHETMIDLLLRKGADRTLRDKNGMTPGQYAYSCGWPRVAAQLGVDIQLSGSMPFFSANMLSNLTSAAAIEGACARGGGYTASVFIDQNFAPSLCSFLGTGSYWGGEHQQSHNLGSSSVKQHGGAELPIPVSCKDIEWLRPSEFMTSPLLWMAQFPNPKEDVVAAPVGRIDFLAEHLASMTPHQVSKLFVNDVNSRCGVFELCLPVSDNVMQTVIVDDHIPCLRGKPLIAYNSNPREYWVPILIKAIAKLCGGYVSLMHGFFSDNVLRLIRNVCGLPDWLRSATDENVSTDYIQFYNRWTGYNRVFTAPKEGQPAAILELGTSKWQYQLINAFVGEQVGGTLISSHHKDDRHKAQKCLTLAPTAQVTFDQEAIVRVVVTGLTGGGGEHVSLLAGPMCEDFRGQKIPLSDEKWIAGAAEHALEAENGAGAMYKDIRLPGHLSPFRFAIAVGSWEASRRFGMQVWAKTQMQAELVQE